ncbi:hypothetical protein K461DRAFT_245395 [Myriangium duriaei CBS 260.36]|uniref:G-protein coupled receptors family 1 profile domain-containing protein n=1 Tax=Myriangium duriaei CBS 260.36 TaxID=1168546 RepID=A0A9P4IWF3_9PEZI|nr:hypothetical protein K461DRAFT_245395 [Myriangium duriaei CBS 260.36]
MGILSVISTSVLLIFLASRFFTWKKHYKSYIGYNQYLVLFINLLLADLIQAASFVFSLYWRHIDAILAPTAACTAQGWLLNLGDVASGLFVLLIAAFTFHSTVNGRRLEHKHFLALVIGTWVFCLLLTVLGPAIHGRTYFVRAGVWCWASALYETERLALHYVWIFAVQASTLVMYLAVLIHVRRTMRATSSMMMSSAARNTTHAKVDKATRVMVLYPVAYIFLTLPLSAGRMWSLAHDGKFLPDSYVLTAGSLIASSGFVDACLYAITRSSMMSTGSTNQSNSESSLKDRISRPAIIRAISARSMKALGVTSEQKPGMTIGRSISVAYPPPDPYSLNSLASTIVTRSNSVPALRAETAERPASYGYGYSSTEYFVARSASGTGLGLSIDGDDDDNYRRRELDLEDCSEVEEEEETTAEERHDSGDVMADKF